MKVTWAENQARCATAWSCSASRMVTPCGEDAEETSTKKDQEVSCEEEVATGPDVAPSTEEEEMADEEWSVPCLHP